VQHCCCRVYTYSCRSEWKKEKRLFGGAIRFDAVPRRHSNASRVKANILTGPPVPPSILTGWMTSLNPLGGSAVPFNATFSRLYRLALDSTPCTLYVVDWPGSTLGPSTPTPYTFPESTIHWAASLDSPGNLNSRIRALRFFSFFFSVYRG